MDQYVSTYHKDYLWPYVKMKSGPTYATEVSTPRLLLQGGSCMRGAEAGGNIPTKEYIIGLEEGGSYEWSRLGPMGPLLDPKLYPVKIGPIPESESTSFDQPSTYLKKLHEKYPYLYNVLQSSPPSDMVRRVNLDRLRTTYQAEFSRKDENSWLDVEEPESSSSLACPKKDIRPELDCRPHIRAAFANLSKIGSLGSSGGSSDGKNTIENEYDKNNPEKKKKAKTSKHFEEDEIPGISVSSPTWKSEYQDSIGETGQSIMKEKIHHFGKMSAGRRKLLAYCS